MRTTRSLACLLLLIAALLAPRVASAQANTPPPGTLARVRAKGEIVVAVDPTSPPFETKEGENLRGFDIDVGNELGKELGVKIRWMPMEWSGVFAALATGKCDLIMSGVTITDERKKGNSFTRPYFLSGQAIARRKGDNAIDGPDSLLKDGHIAAVQQETTGQFAAVKRGVTMDHIHKFDTLQDGLLDVRNKKSDAAIADLPTLKDFLRNGYPELEIAPGGMLDSEFIGVVARPADLDLIAALNRALEIVMLDGTYAKAYQKWVGDPATLDLLGKLAAARNQGTPIPTSVQAETDRALQHVADASASQSPAVGGSAFTIRGDLLKTALPLLLRGAGLTLELTVFTLIIGVPLGLCIALLRLSNIPPLQGIAIVYVEIVRGTPLLMQIYVIYFVLPALGISLPAFGAGLAALSLNSAAYVAEIFRAGIESIDAGQREAARALGMSSAQSMRYVVLPQTFRRVLPPLTNEAVALLKDSSLVSVVALSELMRVGKEIATNAGSPTTIYLAVAVLYLVMTLPLTYLVRRLEVRLNPAGRSRRGVRPTSVSGGESEKT